MTAADAMLEAAWATKRAADERIREAFHARWGRFFKCGVCGTPMPFADGWCGCGGVVRAAGYSWSKR